MKICFVTIDSHSRQGGGGIGSYLNTLSTELVTAGHDVWIVCGRKKDEPEYEEAGRVRVCRVFLGNFHYYISKLPVIRRLLPLPVREIEWSYALWKKVREVSKKERFDVIEGCETGNLFSMLFPHKTPWIIRTHGATYSFKKFSGESVGISEKLDRVIQRFCMKRAAALSAPSEFQAGEIKKEIGSVCPVVVIPNPVDSIFFKKDTAASSKADTEKQKVILYTGRIELRKGTLVLLKAMARLIHEYEDVLLVIAGGRHVSVSERTLDDLLKATGLRSHVKLLGHVPWHEIRRLYEACDIFAVPSYYETFCISAAEAMASGKPVVGASGTALPEVVEDGVTGILVSPGDDKALAGALLRLLNDDALAGRMGEEGRRHAIERYSPQVVAEEMLAFYRTVAA